MIRFIETAAVIAVIIGGLVVLMLGTGFGGGIGPSLLGGAIQILIVLAIGAAVIGIARMLRFFWTRR